MRLCCRMNWNPVVDDEFLLGRVKAWNMIFGRGSKNYQVSKCGWVRLIFFTSAGSASISRSASISSWWRALPLSGCAEILIARRLGYGLELGFHSEWSRNSFFSWKWFFREREQSCCLLGCRNYACLFASCFWGSVNFCSVFNDLRFVS